MNSSKGDKVLRILAVRGDYFGINIFSAQCVLPCAVRTNEPVPTIYRNLLVCVVYFSHGTIAIKVYVCMNRDSGISEIMPKVLKKNDM